MTAAGGSRPPRLGLIAPVPLRAAGQRPVDAIHPISKTATGSDNAAVAHEVRAFRPPRCGPRSPDVPFPEARLRRTGAARRPCALVMGARGEAGGDRHAGRDRRRTGPTQSSAHRGDAGGRSGSARSGTGQRFAGNQQVPGLGGDGARRRAGARRHLRRFARAGAGHGHGSGAPHPGHRRGTRHRRRHGRRPRPCGGLRAAAGRRPGRTGRRAGAVRCDLPAIQPAWPGLDAGALPPWAQGRAVAPRRPAGFSAPRRGPGPARRAVPRRDPGDIPSTSARPGPCGGHSRAWPAAKRGRRR